MKHAAIRPEDSIVLNGDEIRDLARYEVDFNIKSNNLYLHLLYDDERDSFRDNLKRLFKEKGVVEFVHKRDDRIITFYKGTITGIRKVFGFDYIEAYSITIEIHEN